MRTIDDYIDAAKKRNDWKADGAIAKTLGTNHSAVSQWRTRRTWPSDETMLRLADLAGIPRTIALLELNYWRTGPDVQKTYRTILEELHAA